jgi:hypothetical protein
MFGQIISHGNKSGAIGSSAASRDLIVIEFEGRRYSAAGVDVVIGRPQSQLGAKNRRAYTHILYIYICVCVCVCVYTSAFQQAADTTERYYYFDLQISVTNWPRVRIIILLCKGVGASARPTHNSVLSVRANAIHCIVHRTVIRVASPRGPYNTLHLGTLPLSSLCKLYYEIRDGRCHK